MKIIGLYFEIEKLVPGEVELGEDPSKLYLTGEDENVLTVAWQKESLDEIADKVIESIRGESIEIKEYEEEALWSMIADPNDPRLGTGVAEYEDFKHFRISIHEDYDE